MEKAEFTRVGSDWPRMPYFEYYHYKIKSKYNITHHIDITEFLATIKDRGLRFYPSFIYVIIRMVNRQEEFRMAFDEEGHLGFWNYVVPSYTIFHDDDKTFSDLWSLYDPSFNRQYEFITSDMEQFGHVKQVKARANQPAYFCPISVLPWLSFHSMGQDSYSESNLLFPIIRFGKYYKEDDRIKLPLALFVNHAVADGYHTSLLINNIESFAARIADWIDL